MDTQLDNVERAILWNLWAIRGVRHRHLEAMRDRGSLDSLWDLGERAREELFRDLDVGKAARGHLHRRIESVDDPVSGFEAEQSGLPPGSRIVSRWDDAYPVRLVDLEEPPSFLYVRGDLGACRATDTISVVGSREVDVSDARRARQIVADVAQAGVRIVSGGAFGVDRVAHEASMDSGTPTVVVFAGGLDQPTPRSNMATFRRAAQSGAWITEYPLRTDVRPHHFRRRNRLIAALGDVTFVVRAGEKSGTMLTARAAQKIDRPVCTLPGRPEDELAQGCLTLLVEGAQAVRHATDILEIYFPDRPESPRSDEPPAKIDSEAGSAPSLPPIPDSVSEDAQELLECVRNSNLDPGKPIEPDELAAACGWEASKIQTVLLELELHGVCGKKPGANLYDFRPI